MKMNELIRKMYIKFFTTHLSLYAFFTLLKYKILPHRKIWITKKYITELYSEINAAQTREETICNQIDLLKSNISNIGKNCFTDLKKIDFELLKNRFQGSFHFLKETGACLRPYIFSSENTLEISNEILKCIRRAEFDLNHNILLLREIKELSEISIEQISKRRKEKFKKNIKEVLSN